MQVWNDRTKTSSINDPFKGLVHPKIDCQYLLTLMLFQTSMCLFVLLNTKKDIWKNVLIKQISFPIDYYSMYFFLLW